MEIRVCAARQVGRRPGSSRKWSANCKTRSCFLCASAHCAAVRAILSLSLERIADLSCRLQPIPAPTRTPRAVARSPLPSRAATTTAPAPKDGDADCSTQEKPLHNVTLSVPDQEPCVVHRRQAMHRRHLPETGRCTSPPGEWPWLRSRSCQRTADAAAEPSRR